MPARYVSDTTTDCQTISQPRLVDRDTMICSDVSVESWPHMTPVGGAVIQHVPGSWHEIRLPTPQSEVHYSFSADAGIENRIELTGVTASGTGRLVVTEKIGSQEIELASVLVQPSQG